MKHFLRVFLIIFMIQISRAQVVFCPPGTEWNYLFWNWPYTLYQDNVRYVRDSLVGSETVKVLAHDNFFKSMNATYNQLSLIKQSGDTVFMRNRITQHNWQILYNFNVSAGDSWQHQLRSIHGFGGPTVTINYTVLIDSVGMVIENGFSLKRLYARYLLAGWTTEDTVTITERFGCSKFLFNFHNPSWTSEGDLFQGMLCYRDNAFGLKQFSEKPCNYQDMLSVQGNAFNPYQVQIYPNPGNGLVRLSLSNTNENAQTLHVTDLSGREVKRLELEPGLENYLVDLRELANGTYLVVLKSRNTLIYTGKLIKE